MKISINWLKCLISLVAVGVIVLRISYPDIKVDAISLGLMILAVLPWMSELIESAKFPGGWEVKFRDLQKAGSKVTESAAPEVAEAAAPVPPSIERIAESDPNLALVGLRIEIEKRLREYAIRHNINENQPLNRLLSELAKRDVLTSETVSGLRELISAGNQAAHGASVQTNVAKWAIDVGPQILAVLDSKLQ